MRKHTTITALIFLLILPTMASAVYLDSVTGTADCNGWNAEVEITFRPGARLVRLEYAVVLMDDAGAELERFDYVAEVDIPSETVMVYPFGEAWSTALATGSYTMTCNVVLFDVYPGGENRFEDGFTTEFTCGGDTDGNDEPVETSFCPQGSGFWKNHPAEWPVTSLMVGAENMDQNSMMSLLSPSPRGDATVILAKALVTAKLNLAAGAGAGDDIADVIAAADEFLTSHPVGSDPGKADRKTALSFMEELGNYSSGECGDDDDTAGDTSASETGKYGAMDYDKAAAVESMSLGSLKALYR
jgi:hypothetical protein